MFKSNITVDDSFKVIGSDKIFNKFTDNIGPAPNRLIIESIETKYDKTIIYVNEKPGLTIPYDIENINKLISNDIIKKE